MPDWVAPGWWAAAKKLRTMESQRAGALSGREPFGPADVRAQCGHTTKIHSGHRRLGGTVRFPSSMSPVRPRFARSFFLPLITDLRRRLPTPLGGLCSGAGSGAGCAPSEALHGIQLVRRRQVRVALRHRDRLVARSDQRRERDASQVGEVVEGTRHDDVAAVADDTVPSVAAASRVDRPPSAVTRLT